MLYEVITPAPAAPAWAGVASGSFVESHAAASASEPEFAAPTPLSGAARWLTLASFATLGASMLLRAIVVGRGPWGNLSYNFV